MMYSPDKVLFLKWAAWDAHDRPRDDAHPPEPHPQALFLKLHGRHPPIPGPSSGTDCMASVGNRPIALWSLSNHIRGGVENGVGRM